MTTLDDIAASWRTAVTDWANSLLADETALRQAAQTQVAS